MPKRSHKNRDDSDYLRRKIRKLEKKINKRAKRSQVRNCSESSSSSVNIILSPELSDHEDEMEVQPEVEAVPIFGAEEPQPGTSTSITRAPSTDVVQTVQSELPVEAALDPPELDKEILNLLGETPSKEKKYGPDIRGELSVRWEHIATTGLTMDVRKELLEKHLVPKNCKKIDAPKLNPEIKAALSDVLIRKDKALENKQVQVAASISCIGEALNILFSSDHKDQTVIKLLIEAGRLMCDSQHNESMTRRSFICSTIKKDIKDHLYNTEIDHFLFGEQLTDTIRAAKAISKSGAEIKINTPVRRPAPAQRPRQAPTQALNQRPPFPPTTRQAGAARRTEPAPRPRPQQQPRQPPRLQQRPAPRR